MSCHLLSFLTLPCLALLCPVSSSSSPPPCLFSGCLSSSRPFSFLLSLSSPSHVYSFPFNHHTHSYSLHLPSSLSPPSPFSLLTPLALHLYLHHIALFSHSYRSRSPLVLSFFPHLFVLLIRLTSCFLFSFIFGHYLYRFFPLFEHQSSYLPSLPLTLPQTYLPTNLPTYLPLSHPPSPSPSLPPFLPPFLPPSYIPLTLPHLPPSLCFHHSSHPAYLPPLLLTSHTIYSLVIDSRAYSPLTRHFELLESLFIIRLFIYELKYSLSQSITHSIVQ